MMVRTAVISFLMVSFAFAAEHGAYVQQPNLVGRITETLVASKIDHLTPHLSQEGDRKFSYHLKSVTYLGVIERGSETFILATALFIRSSALGHEQPTPRGHGYLLCLSPEFRLISHCRLDSPDVVMVGYEIRREEEVIGDLAAYDDSTRRRGFLINGDDFLPYPFSDKLPKLQAQPTK